MNPKDYLTACSKVKAWGAKCGECPFAKNGEPAGPVLMSAPVGRGPGYLMVGESPSTEDVDHGRVFTGGTGRQLAVELEGARLDRHDAHIVYAIACKPVLKTEGNMKAALKACAPAFRAQVKPLKLDFALVFGKWASLQLFGVYRDKDRGFVNLNKLDVWGHGWRTIQTFNPSFAFFFAPYEWGTFSVDVQRFGRLMRGELREFTRTLQIRPSSGMLRAYFETALKHKWDLGCDIETGAAPGDLPDPDKPGHTLRRTGLNPLTATLKTIAFGDAETRHGLAIEWGTADILTKRLVSRALRSPRLVKVFHNGPWFDHRVLERYGMRVVRWEDTRDLRRALSSTSRLKLGYLASLYNDTWNWKSNEDEDDSKEMAFTEIMDDLLKYNAQDAVETALLWRDMKAEATKLWGGWAGSHAS